MCDHGKRLCIAHHTEQFLFDSAAKRLTDILAEHGFKRTGKFKFWLGCDPTKLASHVITHALQQGIDITDPNNSSDHIIPLSCASPVQGEPIDVRKIFILTNYRNLRMIPLSANLAKAGNCTGEAGQDHLDKMKADGYDDTDLANIDRQNFFAKNTAPCSDKMKLRAARQQKWDMKRR